MATPGHIENTELPVIALVGRVNVGKSTLFNTLIEQTKAIVSSIPGTTRTNNEGFLIWQGKHAKVIDTGGLTFDENVPLEDDIIKQSEAAVSLADVILFVTDSQTGILPQELELAKRLRKVKDKTIFVLANKADSVKKEANIYTGGWEKLALGEVIPVSAASGRNTGDLLDLIFETLEKQGIKTKLPPVEREIQITLIGKPNVGKSSLFNKIIGEDKVIVSELAHTTREPFDTLIKYPYTDDEKTKEVLINFVDTAGIRRKARVGGSLEKVGIHKSIDSIEKSDIILFVIDGTEVISSQDMQLGGLLERRSKSVIILVNKWDLAEDSSDHARSQITKKVYSYFPHLNFAPILFVSGKTGLKVHQVFPMIMKVWKSRHTKIANRGLEKFLEAVVKQHKPARGKGTNQPKVLGFHQIATAPPIFELFIKYRTSLHRSYLNFLENRLREQFDFIGTPIVIKLKKVKR